MRVVDLINKKKNNKKLTEQEFDFLVKGILDKSIKDYQVSALLMAICINGLDEKESFYLTKAMTINGEILNLKSIKGTILDKHSTGGIGDKVSIIFTPILACFGIYVAKMSGKGLGFTGGTIDKLHSVNVNTELEPEEYIKILKKHHMFVISQSEKIAPADKVMYAIRDTSGTVDNISLIASSIMSKKLATNADVIYLDVKVGDGAFLKTIKEAQEFSKLCIKIGKKFDKKVIAHLTNMDKPLGYCMGNLIEIKESVEFLNGIYKESNLSSLIFDFITDVLLDLKIVKDKKEAKQRIKEVIDSKQAYNKFKEWAIAQGSNYDFDNISNVYQDTKYKHEIKATKKGYINFKSNEIFGYSLIDIKAGRVNKEDPIDYLSGIELNKTYGNLVNKNDVIMTIYSNIEIDKKVISNLQNNITYSAKPIRKAKNVLEVIK